MPAICYAILICLFFWNGWNASISPSILLLKSWIYLSSWAIASRQGREDERHLSEGLGYESCVCHLLWYDNRRNFDFMNNLITFSVSYKRECVGKKLAIGWNTLCQQKLNIILSRERRKCFLEKNILDSFHSNCNSNRSMKLCDKGWSPRLSGRTQIVQLDLINKTMVLNGFYWILRRSNIGLFQSNVAYIYFLRTVIYMKW